MNFVLHPWYIVLLTASRNFNDTDADDYLRGTVGKLEPKSNGARLVSNSRARSAPNHDDD
jgi:hypothetical protein